MQDSMVSKKSIDQASDRNMDPCILQEGGRRFRLKLCKEESIRMVIVGEELSMQSLLETIRKTFETKGDIVVTYEDAEGESITVGTDEELRLALVDMSSSQAVGKLMVSEKEKVRPVPGHDHASKLCKFFRRGYCKNGPRCRFLHSSCTSASNRVRALSAWEIERWLEGVLGRSTADNIEELSSSEGLKMLCDVAASLHLTQKAADMLATLLTKEEMRTSMLRHETNRIYGSLVESRFVLHLQAHMNDRLPRTDASLKPYLLLIEELQLRTSDGWKYLPLDAADKTIQELPQTPMKHELAGTLDALLEHRRKHRLQMATTDPDAALQGAEFRNVPIIPVKDELMSLVRAPVPVNRVGLRYTSVVEYLETHFRLLREDFIEPLRQGIKQYVNRHGGYMSELRIYTDVELKGLRFTANGIESKLSFVAERGRRKSKLQEIDWEHSKRLMFGSLLCMSRDNFRTITWATVAGRNDLGKNEVAIRLVDRSDDLDPSAKYVMVESAAAYFEAYSHVLRSLQMEEMEKIPFQLQLISLERNVKEPAYLESRAAGDSYDFRSVFPDMVKELGSSSSTFHILKEWPEWKSNLDSSQRAALKLALTKNLALIQGPPGTGKTFVGLLVVNLLLANLKGERSTTSPGRFSARWGPEPEGTGEQAFNLSGPVLIVCYTNHALDQFLEGVYCFEQNLVRIGGRGKSKKLDGRNLQVLLQQSRQNRDLDGLHLRRSAEARGDRKRLETEIGRLIRDLNAAYVTRDQLHGVATEEQIYSLFDVGRTAVQGENVVQVWLEGGSFQDRHDRAPVANRFAPLMDDEGSQGSDSESVKSSAVNDVDVAAVAEVPLNDAGPEAADRDGWLQIRSGRADQAEAEAADADLQQEDVDAEQQEVHNDGEEQEGQQRQREVLDVHVDAAPVIEFPLQEIVDYPDVWSLPRRERKRLHSYWLEEIHDNAQRQLAQCKQDYEAASTKCREADSEIQLSLLRKAKVIGMTTTAAARLHDILAALKPEIVVVEEAAEVLESHILACIGPYTKHLILIGDHQQLRPSVATFKLAQKHKLDVSMFERLVQSGVEHTMLTTQRRMRPSIAKLIAPIYPQLKNHSSVLAFDEVKGLKSSVFFMEHEALEEAGHEAGSKVNTEEARIVVELCSYLLKQEAYTPKDITILAMYKGQVQEISRRLKDRLQYQFRAWGRPLGPDSEAEASEASHDAWMPRVSSVDDFQGEENDIILLSLVRSNLVPGKEKESTIGFLKTSNRVCVALSRARKGLYIFGNAQLLALKSPLWKGILHQLGQDGLLGSKLVLSCQNHPGVETRVQHAEDFIQVGDGGCSRPCEYQLECGHACSRRCHPGSHDKVICPKQCLKPYDGCSHRCTKFCHGKQDSPCPRCEAPVTKKLPTCGHEQSMPCSKDPGEARCKTLCDKLLPCGHLCPKTCTAPCAEVYMCNRVVRKDLACGHSANMRCSQEPRTFSCLEPCNEILSCGHKCGGTCGICVAANGTHIPCKQPCNRDLFCGHQCKAKCSVPCPPCSQHCRKRCRHSKCSTTCGTPCKQCLEPCSWRCRHFECGKLCYEICERPRCNMPCTKRLPCRHPCIGLCGEPCPSACRVCHPGTFDAITQMTLEESEVTDRFIELLDCGHLFEVSGLDQWMDMDDNASASSSKAIVLKSCPACKTPVRRSFRYSNVVKKKLQQIELVKMKVYGHEQTRAGMEMLQRKQYREAQQHFQDIIKLHPGLPEAHFGIAQALSALKQFELAIVHARFIAERSSTVAAEVQTLPSLTLKGPYDPFFGTGLNSSIIGAPSFLLAMQALVQWGSALTGVKDFSNAVRLCEIVLKHDRNNAAARELKTNAEKGLTHQIVEVVSTEFGARGHWFQCPNGHVYAVGECGGPMETSRCPDCGSVIGGQSHEPAQGNTHSRIDGSTHALYSEFTGLGNHFGNLDFNR